MLLRIFHTPTNVHSFPHEDCRCPSRKGIPRHSWFPERKCTPRDTRTHWIRGQVQTVHYDKAPIQQICPMKIPRRPHCRQLKPHDHASSFRWNPACECRSRCWPCWGTFWEFACGMREKSKNEATRKLDTMSTACLKFAINKYIKEGVEKKN